MTSDWQSTTLGTAFDIRMGRQRSPKNASGAHMVAYLRAANIKDGELLLHDVKKMNFSPDEQATFRLDPGDVLVTEGCGSRDEVGASARWDSQIDGPVCFQNTLLRMRCVNGLTTPGFAEVIARFFYSSGRWADVASGTNIFHIGAKRAEAIPINLPPLEQQRRIVDLIGSIDTCIDRLEGQIDATRAARAGVLSELFLAYGHDWDSPLGEITTSRLGKMLDKNKRADGTPMPYLRNVNVQWGAIDLRDLSEMGFSDDDRVEFALRSGDVLICEGGEPGRAAVVEEDLKDIYFQKALHRVRCSDRLLPHFLVFALEHLTASGGLASLITSTSIAHLTGVKLRQLRIPCPPRQMQEEVVRLIGSCDAQIAALETESASVRAVRRGVLAEILSGERLLDDSYDTAVGL